jgi:hypothetical protein
MRAQMIAKRDELVDPADSRYWGDRLAALYRDTQKFDGQHLCAPTWEFYQSVIADLEAGVSIWEGSLIQTDSVEATE